MIYESWPWRRELLRDADVLDRWHARPVSERRSVIIERKVFIGAYAMRRLLQSDKLSTSTETRGVALDWFPSTKPMGKNDRWRIDLHYDFAAGAQTTLTAPRLLDLIIHSYVFQEWQDEDAKETSFVFTSDRTRDKHLWLLRLQAFIDLMRFVANDDPATLVRRFDDTERRWVEWRGAGNQPS